MNVHIVTMRGPEIGKEGIAEGIKLDPFECDRSCTLSLIERGGANRVDRTGSAGRPNPRGVMRERWLRKQHSCAGCDYNRPDSHEDLPLV